MKTCLAVGENGEGLYQKHSITYVEFSMFHTPALKSYNATNVFVSVCRVIAHLFKWVACLFLFFLKFRFPAH